jgi:DNA-directed RNA polymerase subunit RPC12/RpoP
MIDKDRLLKLRPEDLSPTSVRRQSRHTVEAMQPEPHPISPASCRYASFGVGLDTLVPRADRVLETLDCRVCRSRALVKMERLVVRKEA